MLKWVSENPRTVIAYALTVVLVIGGLSAILGTDAVIAGLDRILSAILGE